MCSGFRLRASHPLWSDFPFASPNGRTTISGSYNPSCKQLVWALPLSLATTYGIDSLSVPLVTEMFHFTRYCVSFPMYSGRNDRALPQSGYPIRKSTGQSVFAAIRSLSQLVTSFIAFWHQGIHYVLFVA